MPTPAGFDPGANSASLYRLTQPWVVLRYFKSFFLPTELSADNDWDYVSPLGAQALAGYLFVALLLWAAVAAGRRRETRPIAFGIWWFFLALLPTSLLPLADVANDHRMFFPFVGLALAVFWGLRLLLFRIAAGGRLPVPARTALALGMAALLVGEAAATRRRNEVWHDEEALWRDVTLKSPGNLRGWLSYGRALTQRGDYTAAVQTLEQAAALAPASPQVQEDLALAWSGRGQDAEAVKHFARAIVLAPGTSDPYFYYGQWLKSRGRLDEARELLERALRIDPAQAATRYVLLDVYSAQKDDRAFDALVQETLALARDSEPVRRYVEDRANAEKIARATGRPPLPDTAAPGGQDTPETLLHLSSEYGKSGRFEEAIRAAQKALALKPDYAEAYNNIAAACLAMHRWDDGFRAATQALRLKPDFALARRNLERALAGRSAAPPARPR